MYTYINKYFLTVDFIYLFIYFFIKCMNIFLILIQKNKKTYD